MTQKCNKETVPLAIATPKCPSLQNCNTSTINIILFPSKDHVQSARQINNK